MAILRSYLGYFPDNNIFRTLWSDIKDSEIEQHIDPTQYSLVKNSQYSFIERSIEMARKRYPESLMLSIFNYEYLKSLDNELRQHQTNVLSFLREKTDLSILVGTTREAIHLPIEAQADLKFDVNLINGSLFLRPVSPVGPIFGLSTNKVNGIPRINLRVLV
jgi:hypothetical protein